MWCCFWSFVGFFQISHCSAKSLDLSCPNSLAVFWNSLYIFPLNSRPSVNFSVSESNSNSLLCPFTDSNQIHLILAFFCCFFFLRHRFVCTEWIEHSNFFLVMCRPTTGINLWTCAIYEIRFSSLFFVLILIHRSLTLLIKQIRHSWHRTRKKINERWNAVCNCSCL